jgi:uncharacterized membrane protein
MASSVFSESDLVSIQDSVGAAELRTSAEIRVYLDKHVKGDPLDHAAYLFKKLGMSATALRNGVMIYIAYSDRKFCIIGDVGIHQHLGDHFWITISTKMEEAFRAGLMREGVTNAVREVGEALAAHFPRMKNDINELSDEVQTGF